MKIEHYTCQYVDIKIPINDPGYPQIQPGQMLVSEFSPGSYACCKLHCPCGCGQWILLTLQNSEYKHPGYWWTLTVDEKNQPTIVASVNMFGFPCKSHFWITGGKVIWA